MKVWAFKGNRIRASDKSLVYHFCIGWLLLLFVAVFLLLNLRQLLVTDWKDFNLFHAGFSWTAYNSITVLIAIGVCALVAFLYYHYGYDRGVLIIVTSNRPSSSRMFFPVMLRKPPTDSELVIIP